MVLAAGRLGLFFSTISELVDKIMPAMDEAFCKAERVTFTGSTMPAATPPAFQTADALTTNQAELTIFRLNVILSSRNSLWQS